MCQEIVVVDNKGNRTVCSTVGDLRSIIGRAPVTTHDMPDDDELCLCPLDISATARACGMAHRQATSDEGHHLQIWLLEPAPLIPQVLKLVFPQIEGEWYMAWAGSQWVLTRNRTEATVFPSERIARRYAVPYLTFGKVYKPEPSGAPALPASPSRCRSCGCTETFACPSRCHWIEPGLCSECGPGKDELESWVVYGPTREHPDKFVARKHLSGIPTDIVVTAESVEEIQAKRSPLLVPVPRSDVDPPEIIESWM